MNVHLRNADFIKSLLLKIGLPFGVITVVFFIALWLSTDINNRLSVIHEQRQELAAKSQEAATLLNLKSDYERVKNYFSVLDNILPAKDQLIQFPRQVGDIGKRNKIDVGLSFGAEEGSSENSPGTVAFTMSVAGEYDNIITFLRELQRGRYLISWNTFDFGGKNAGKFQGNITGKVFFQ